MTPQIRPGACFVCGDPDDHDGRPHGVAVREPSTEGWFWSCKVHDCGGNATTVVEANHGMNAHIEFVELGKDSADCFFTSWQRIAAVPTEMSD